MRDATAKAAVSLPPRERDAVTVVPSFLDRIPQPSLPGRENMTAPRRDLVEDMIIGRR